MSTKALFEKMSEEMRKLSVNPSETDAFDFRVETPGPLDAFLSAGPVVVSVFNHLSFKYIYISPNVEPLIGIAPVAFLKLDYRKFLEMHMHPKDMETVALKLMPDVVNHIAEQAHKDILRFSVHYNYRLKTASGGWINIEQQSSAIKLDQKGKILLEQSFYAQSGEADYHASYPLKLVISYKNGKGLYEQFFSRIYLPNQEKSETLTPRELEVLAMLAHGHTSSHIAHTLCISETTIITHRRNMLHKLKLKNTNELIAWAYQAGVL